MSPAVVLSPRPLALAVAALLAGSALTAKAETDATDIDTVHVTASQIARRALGTSTITAEDIAVRPPANDIAELLRTMPGVNLTGNSASGQYGNNRQIDLRGMGPENTLIWSTANASVPVMPCAWGAAASAIPAAIPTGCRRK